MNSRRDLLKHFGIGAIIAPVIGGVVEPAAAAKLISIPDIRPVELFSKIPEPINLLDVRTVKLVVGMADGTTRTLDIDQSYGFGTLHPKDFLSAEIRFSTAAVQSVSPAIFKPVGDIAGTARMS